MGSLKWTLQVRLWRSVSRLGLGSLGTFQTREGALPWSKLSLVPHSLREQTLAWFIQHTLTAYLLCASNP